FTRRRATLGFDPDALARRPVGHLFPDTQGTRISALIAPAPTDRPDKIGLDGARRLVDVMAVKTEARFEPQGITGAKTDRLNLRLSEQRLDKVAHLKGADRNLEPVLAGIARA